MILLFIFDLADFLTNSSDHAESADFVLEEPQNKNPETSALSYPQGDNHDKYFTVHC